MKLLINIYKFSYGRPVLAGQAHNTNLLIKHFSTSTAENLHEWLRGFTDGEGCFLFTPLKTRPFTFKFVFKIKLHKDDRPLLEYLKTRLNIGNVYPVDISDTNKSCTWEVFKKEDLLKLIEILDKQPLNTTKYLDYILWRKAFYMYLELQTVSKDKKTTIKENILALKEQMNDKRASFDLPSDHQIYISPYWLLGFIEGEAWFHVKAQTSILVFGIGQTINQKPIIEAIAQFMNNLKDENSSASPVVAAARPSQDIKQNSTAKLLPCKVTTKSIYKSSKPFVYIQLSQLDYILKVFIPFLDSLHFLSKKGLDYQDWKTVALLRKDGVHLTPEGKVIIANIRNRMNNNRLSTNVKLVEEGID